MQYLYDLHPEMFKKPSDTFRVIKEIQNNPNRYYKNNRVDISLVAKDLQDGKLGKMGIVTQGENIGKVGHLSVSSNVKKEIERLNKKNIENLAVGAPHPTLRSADITQGEQKAGAKAHSPSSDEIIPQTTNQSKEIKSFDDIKNGFLQDMKQKKDEIKAQITKEYEQKIKDAKSDLEKINLKANKSKFIALELGKRVKKEFSGE